MREVLAGLVDELRAAGLPVSLTEHLDAASALLHIPLEDRDALKAALGATLVKSSAHWPAFETAFEVYFSARRAPRAGGEDARAETGEPVGERGAGGGRGGRAGELEDAAGAASGAVSAETLAALLLRALLEGAAGMAAEVARHAVARYAGIEPGRPVAGTYYAYRTLRRLDLDALLDRLAQEDRLARGTTPLEARLAADEYRARAATVRRAVEAEVRRRLVEDRGAAAVAQSVRHPLPEDVDVMRATKEELAAITRALQPLSRKLAVRLARRRRHRRRGPLDVRSTLRHSLSTGGVPVEPRFRHAVPSRPEIVLLADVSGSVASFARFTLQLVHAISAQFSKVRSFVFVDGVDEVTAYFERGASPAVAVRRVITEADVVRADGHSDYGRALAELEVRYRDAVTARTTVIVLGDARTNYHASGAAVLEGISGRARHLYWLNPEPHQYWGSGDSVIAEYASSCEAVVECRTLRQLERFVGELA